MLKVYVFALYYITCPCSFAYGIIISSFCVNNNAVLNDRFYDVDAIRSSRRHLFCLSVSRWVYAWASWSTLFQETGQLDLIKICSYYVNLAQRCRRQVAAAAAVCAEKSTVPVDRARGPSKSWLSCWRYVTWCHWPASLIYGVSHSAGRLLVGLFDTLGMDCLIYPLRKESMCWDCCGISHCADNKANMDQSINQSVSLIATCTVSIYTVYIIKTLG